MDFNFLSTAEDHLRTIEKDIINNTIIKFREKIHHKQTADTKAKGRAPKAKY